MRIESLDTIPLNEFTLSWRWLEKERCSISPDHLARIRPLSENASKEVWAYTSDVSQDNTGTPNSELFKFTTALDCATVSDDMVKEWLSKLIPGTDQLLVNWQPDQTIITASQIFVTHWSDFCYPSSDDVTICPVNKAWVVNWWHEEVLHFGSKDISIKVIIED